MRIKALPEIMKYLTFSPSESLSGLVRFFWLLEGEASPEQPYLHRTMADGSAELVFHYRGIFDEMAADGKNKRSFSSGISGPSSTYYRYRVSGNFSLFGVYLYPFAIPAIFGLPAAELSNQTPDLYAIFGREAGVLEEQIFIARNTNERIKILTRFFEGKLAKRKERESAILPVKYLIHSGGEISIGELARRYFVSDRQLERNFRQNAGFSPKLYARIIRFQASIKSYGLPNKSLTEIAYECGYYDQSHFIHDFREFSGYQPGQYFSGNNEATAWKEA